MPEEDKTLSIKSFLKIYFFSILSLLVSDGFSNPFDYDLEKSIVPEDSTLSIEIDSLPMHFIAFSSILTSNNLETGWASIERVPQVITGIMYYTPIGFYLNVDYNRFFNVDELSHGLNLDIGYSLYLDQFEFGIDFNKNYFKGDTLLDDYIYKQALATNIVYHWSNYSNSMNASIIMDKNIDYQLSFENTAYFELNQVLTSKDVLSFEPGLSFNFGTENWLVNSDIFTFLLRGSVLNRNNFVHKDFSYLGTDIYIPFGYSIGNFSIEGQFMYFIPSMRYIDLGIGNQSAFIISLSYILDL